MPRRTKRPVDENDFPALDKLARGVTLDQLRPMNATERVRWRRAKRGNPARGKSEASAVAAVVFLDSELMARADAYARRAGISRSELFDRSLRKVLPPMASDRGPSRAGRRAG